jgi:NTE family protein
LIEDLPIPYAAVATDIRHRKEVVFEEGSLYEAIRASISMPTIFTPHIIGDMLLIDGGVVNPVPIDKVKRTPGDILVVVDLNGPYIKESPEEVVEHPSVFSETIDIIDDYFENLKNKVESFVDSFKSDEQLQSEAEYQEHIQKGGSEPDDMNVVEIMQESSSLMLQVIADKMIEHFPPDVLVRIAKNAYSTLEFYKFEEICALGKKLMNRALDEYEAR